MVETRPATGPTSADEPDTDPAGAESAPVAPARHPWSARRKVVLVAVAVVVLALVGAVAAVARLQGNIAAVDITDQLGTDRPSANVPNGPGAFPGALTIAVFGDDTRSGDNGFVGGQKGAGRSDTALVVHLNAARTQLQVVSIPRDSMVQRPSCTRKDGTTIPAALDQFNAAYTEGGAACSIRTIEKLTGVRIDEYVVVDFNGFRKIVDAVGGVEVCVPKAINDKESGLDIPAGRTLLNGQQALAFVRTRHGVGDGSDLGRIELQQQFLGALATKVKSMNLVTDAPRLYAFLDAVTSSLTTSPKLAQVTNLVGLAQDLQRLPADGIVFRTVPTAAYPADPNRVQWTAKAEELWRAMREDQPFPTATPSSAHSSGSGSSGGSSGGSSAPGSGHSGSEGPGSSSSSAGGSPASVC